MFVNNNDINDNSSSSNNNNHHHDNNNLCVWTVCPLWHKSVVNADPVDLMLTHCALRYRGGQVFVSCVIVVLCGMVLCFFLFCFLLSNATFNKSMKAVNS